MKAFFYLTLFYLYLEPSFANNKQKQNVLLIVVDDLRPSIGAYGDPNAFTPNIDNLAKNGVTFKMAFAQQALCAPSRNSFLTSRRPDTLHLYDFYSYWRTFVGNFTTLPQFFKENNYYTKSVGKIFHPGVSSNMTDDYPLSWSEEPWHAPSEKFKDSPVCLTAEGSFANLVCPVDINLQPLGTLPDIEIMQEAGRFLMSYGRKKEKKLNDQHFFLAVGFHKPHIPLKFPKKYLELHPKNNITLPGLRTYPPGLPPVAWNPWTDIRKRHDIAGLNVSFPFKSLPDEWVLKIRQAYFSSVSYIDDMIGMLLKYLKTFELHKDTIVILLADHGWSLGEHGEWSKYSNFDNAVRVPLIFRIPNVTYFPDKGGTKMKNMEIFDPVELVDVFPTLVDLVGLDPIQKCPKHSSNTTLCTDGKSLVSVLEKKINLNLRTETKSEETYALSQYPRPSLEPTKGSDKPRLDEIKFMGYSIRTNNYRYTEWISWDPKTFTGNWTNVINGELYAHDFDEDENTNLFGRPELEETQTYLSHLLRTGFGVE